MEGIFCNSWSCSLKQFRFRLRNQKDIENLEQQAKEAGLNEADFLEKKWLHGGFETPLKDEKLREEIKKLKLTNRKLEIELNFEQRFDKTPSSQAKKAIKERVAESGFNPPEQIEEDKLKDFISNNFMKFLQSLRMEGNVTVNCKLCPTGFPDQVTKEKAVERLKLHLFQTHAKEISEMIQSV